MMKKNIALSLTHSRCAALVATTLFGITLIYAAPGRSAELVDHTFHNVGFTTCKVDLQRDVVRMFWKDKDKALFGRFSRLQTWLNQRGDDIVCATNAGIYDVDYRPRGLYIENGVTLRKLNVRKNAYGNFYLQPNGVLLIRDQHVEILDTDRVQENREELLHNVLFATQSGPILVQNGKINALFARKSENRLIRNAVCTTSPHEIQLVLSRGPVNFYEFAQFLRDTLACTDALYLDGNVSRMYPVAGADFGPDFGVMIAVTRKMR